MARKPKARGDGEGSIFARSHKWVAEVTFIAPDGSRKIVRRVAEAQADARKKLTELKGDQDAHRLVVTNKATVRNWIDVWLDEFIKPKRAPRTYCNYHDVLEQHFPERLGKMPLARLATEDLIRFHDTRHSCGTLLHAQGSSPFTIQTVLGHSQLSTTKRYTHVPMEVAKTALAGLESLVEATRKKPESQPDAKPAANQRQSEPIQ